MLRPVKFIRHSAFQGTVRQMWLPTVAYQREGTKIPDTDEFLMAGFQTGEDACFELLFDRYSARVINFAYRFLGSREEAEDVAQEVFLRLYRGKERYDSARPFRPWLFAISARLISNRIRDRKRHPRISMDQSSDDEHPVREFQDRSPSPAQSAAQKDLVQKVHEALGLLPENQRSAVFLAKFENLSYEEIGQVLDMSVSSVKSLLFRARQTLKDCLASLSPE